MEDISDAVNLIWNEKQEKKLDIAMVNYTGSFHPVTKGHVNMVEKAHAILTGKNQKDLLTTNSCLRYDMVVVVVALNDDAYLAEKMKEKRENNIMWNFQQRKKMLSVATRNLPYVFVSSKNASKTIQEITEDPQVKRVAKVTRYELNGADDVVKHKKWLNKNNLITVGRGGVDTDTAVLEQAKHMNANSFIVIRGDEDDISSTKVRRLLNEKKYKEMEKYVDKDVVFLMGKFSQQNSPNPDPDPQLFIKVNLDKVYSTETFYKWSKSHTVKVDGETRQEIGLKLFVFHALHDDSTDKWIAKVDENGKKWNSKISRSKTSEYKYNDKKLEIIHHELVITVNNDEVYSTKQFYEWSRSFTVKVDGKTKKEIGLKLFVFHALNDDSTDKWIATLDENGKQWNSKISRSKTSEYKYNDKKLEIIPPQRPQPWYKSVKLKLQQPPPQTLKRPNTSSSPSSKRTKTTTTKKNDLPQSNAVTIQGCDAYKAMCDVYQKGFAPPKWTIDECKRLLQEYGESATLYFMNESIDNIKNLATKREPVNIGMNRLYYDTNKLHSAFGYTEGLYGEMMEPKLSPGAAFSLPPQFAISCITPVENPYDRKERKDVAMINLIGAAFDNNQQPDHELWNKNWKQNKSKLVEFMTNVYKFAFQATRDMKRTYLCASPIGDGAFRPKQYPHDQFIKNVFEPALKAAHRDYKDIKIIEAQFPDYNVPSCFFDEQNRFSHVDDKVFINAWDCWSMPGNGNGKDNSLDGFWGRSSAIALLCWPTSNKSMKYVDISDSDTVVDLT